MVEKHIHNGLGGDAPKIKYSNLQGIPGTSYRSFTHPHDVLSGIGDQFSASNSTYTVPDGKVAYINSIYSRTDDYRLELTVDSIEAWAGFSNFDDGSTTKKFQHLHSPILAKTSIVSDSAAITATGFIVDEDADIDPVAHKASSGVGGTAYTVPTGKVFVLLSIFASSDENELIVVVGGSDYTIAKGKKNEYDAVVGLFAGTPMIFNEGDIVSTRTGGGIINIFGYTLTK